MSTLTWRLVTRRDADGNVTLYRTRLVLPERPDLRRFAQAVIVRWPYSASDEFTLDHPGRGFPDAATNHAQLQFETALDPLMCENDDAELMLVITGQGCKEWLYYTPDRNRFRARFKALLAGKPTAPVQITFHGDARWSRWLNALKLLVAGFGA